MIKNYVNSDIPLFLNMLLCCSVRAMNNYKYWDIFEEA